MIRIDFDLKNIKTNHLIKEINVDDMKFFLEFIYNSKDDYLYLAILDSNENKVLGASRVVPIVDYFALNPSKTDWGKQLRFIKINDDAEEVDKITADNICKDYCLYLI